MLQRDYFIRLIEEFQAALRKFLEKVEDDRKDAELKDLYRQYVGSYEVLRNLSIEEIMTYAAAEWSDAERMERLGFLAELLYAEGCYKVNPLRDLLLGKAYRLFDYLDGHSGTMSLDRMQKMAQIRRMAPESVSVD